ncbi:HTH-type transcriptional repressor YtrA [Clostridium acetireducens DSM 10703]|uniref:HTH-type transcriptional repressor YtrA n=1 Tax=Clostridium acetireducens DSM 10703 TaxID=1121290 RepID=A0A1E8EZE3_9CLOT|nr:GntR family transcriptional regulator [Clostridium acetireducens]OFI06070.1 HTH-type transcriptional repressor YtrA [Clostridium acetireducens DSM 10703]
MINIDGRSSTPIYEQIINAIKEDILKGILMPGDKLPSVRELSLMVTANPNTVSRAYKELEREKVIETLRGKGTYVSKNYKPKMEEDKMEALKESLKKIIIEAHYVGLKKEDVLNIVNEIYKNIKGNSK